MPSRKYLKQNSLFKRREANSLFCTAPLSAYARTRMGMTDERGRENRERVLCLHSPWYPEYQKSILNETQVLSYSVPCQLFSKRREYSAFLRLPPHRSQKSGGDQRESALKARSMVALYPTALSIFSSLILILPYVPKGPPPPSPPSEFPFMA